MYHCGENEMPRDLARAVSIYKTAPRFGNHPMAMNALAILHEYGWGVKDSKVLALQRYVKTASAGSEMALANLGRIPVSYTHLRAHETDSYLVCRLLLEKK